MAAAPQHLTVEDFERRYGDENGWEYWFGKAVRKPVPTWAHAILQQWIAELIRQAGYVTGPEVDLRASPDWRPRPDVACVRTREGRYPDKLDIAVEILSDDAGRYILEKCRNYEKVGVPQIFVLNPETQVIHEWSNAQRARLRATKRGEALRKSSGGRPIPRPFCACSSKRLVERTLLRLANGVTISGETIWREFDRRMNS